MQDIFNELAGYFNPNKEVKEESVKPLYKLLNEKRTQGIVNATTQTYLGFYELQFPNKETLCNIPKVNDNERYIANAEYTALAVNNLASIADALNSFIKWVDETDISTHTLYDKGILRKAKKALKSIS